MSEPKRYAMTWATDEDEFVYVSPVESASGQWVNYEDYASVKAENEELHKDYEDLADEHTKLIDRNARLKTFSDEAQAHIAKEERKSRERLNIEQAENARLKAEVERLKKSLNKMTNTPAEADGVEVIVSFWTKAGSRLPSSYKTFWMNAAKEGKPSV